MDGWLHSPAPPPAPLVFMVPLEPGHRGPPDVVNIFNSDDEDVPSSPAVARSHHFSEPHRRESELTLAANEAYVESDDDMEEDGGRDTEDVDAGLPRTRPQGKRKGRSRIASGRVKAIRFGKEGSSMPSANPEEATGSVMKVAVTVGAYIVTFIAASLLRAAVLGYFQTLPFFTLWVQFIVTNIVLHGLQSADFIRQPELDFGMFKTIAPVAGLNILGAIMASLSASWPPDDARSFFHVARCASLPLTALYSYLNGAPVLDSYPLPASPISLAIVTTGCIMATLLETSITIPGAVLGLICAATVSAQAVLTKNALRLHGWSALDLVYAVNLLCMVAISPVVPLSGELTTMKAVIWDESGLNSLAVTPDVGLRSRLQGFGMALQDEDKGGAGQSLGWVEKALGADGLFAGRPLWPVLIGATIAGLCGFAMNATEVFQIQVTSPVSHMISSGTRGVVETMIAVVVFNDIVTSAGAVGIVLVSIGSGLYVWSNANGHAGTQPG